MRSFLFSNETMLLESSWISTSESSLEYESFSALQVKIKIWKKITVNFKIEYTFLNHGNLDFSDPGKLEISQRKRENQ